MRMKTPIACGALCAIVLLGLPVRAEAFYLDPGSGSIVIQVLIGGLLAAITTAKLYWSRIRSVFRKDTKEPVAK